MNPTSPVAGTCAQMIREKIPNLFRLYLNPFVVQACICLNEYVRSTWPAGVAEDGYQTFLANAFDEGLSGAIKLARYCANLQGQSPAGLVIDPGDRLGPFASLCFENGGRLQFVPQLTVMGSGDSLTCDFLPRDARYGFVVVTFPPSPAPCGQLDALKALFGRPAPLLVVCVDRNSLAACRQGTSRLPAGLTPDIVVFDESFTNRQVPFAAFTAKKALYRHWNERGKSAFHSTTFQPNTIASLHFLRCLEEADPTFHSNMAGQLERIREDSAYCRALLAEAYSPFLANTIRTLGFHKVAVHADGHYIQAGDRRIFDGVAGVACSVRGHNPETYVEEIGAIAEASDTFDLLAVRLKELTGLEHLLPAVSGATAVENALRVGLAAQFPKNYVLALKGGFGGKTLFALTGTARDTYKQNLDPLYENVLYIDPFGPNVLADLESAFTRYPVAVVQLELIQAVGGVRPIPRQVLEYLETHKSKWQYCLFVDEVQTGMFRTGPFALSEKLGVRPDLMSVGKGTSDMMFPFALTLYSAAVQAKLAKACPGLPGEIRRRYDYAWGYKTVQNVLKKAETLGLAEKVAEAGTLFAQVLAESLASCKAVREMRVHGLLIGIELETRGWARRWFGKKLSSLYLLKMLRHAAFPLFVGFCQYEPNVLKLTPPLTITPNEIHQVCATLAAVLRTPLVGLLPEAVGALVNAYVGRNGKAFRKEGMRHEHLAR